MSEASVSAAAGTFSKTGPMRHDACWASAGETGERGRSPPADLRRPVLFPCSGSAAPGSPEPHVARPLLRRTGLLPGRPAPQPLLPGALGRAEILDGACGHRGLRPDPGDMQRAAQARFPVPVRAETGGRAKPLGVSREYGLLAHRLHRCVCRSVRSAGSLTEPPGGEADRERPSATWVFVRGKNTRPGRVGTDSVSACLGVWAPASGASCRPEGQELGESGAAGCAVGGTWHVAPQQARGGHYSSVHHPGPRGLEGTLPSSPPSPAEAPVSLPQVQRCGLYQTQPSRHHPLLLRLLG